MATFARRATFRQAVDGAGIEKMLSIELAASGTVVRVTHTIVNRLYRPIEVAPWAITAVVPASVAVRPQPPFRPHPEAIFTAGDYLEVETLGPLALLPPGGETTHEERWALAPDVSLPPDDEPLAETLTELARQLLGSRPS